MKENKKKTFKVDVNGINFVSPEMENWAFLSLFLFLSSGYFVLGQEYGALTPPYFNIAENRNVTVNATCGEGVALKEVYCKLVGYDRFEGLSAFKVLDGQVCGPLK